MRQALVVFAFVLALLGAAASWGGSIDNTGCTAVGDWPINCGGPSGPGGQPTYYVSNTGNDSNTGLSPAQAWQTVAKVNAQTFHPGTNVLFQAGGTWHEELEIPSSGQVGSLITFGSYGSGAAPIITGADIVGGGGWTETSVSPIDTQTFATGGLSGTFWSNTACSFVTSPVNPGSSYSMQCSAGNAASISATAPGTNVVEIDEYFQLQSATATSGEKTRVNFMEGMNWNGANGVALWVSYNGTNYQLSVGRGSAIGSQAYNITTGTWYQLRFLVSSNSGNSTDFADLYVGGTLESTVTGMSLTSPVNDDLKVGGEGAYNDVFTENFDALTTYNQNSTGATNVWYTTVAWQPYAVIFNESQNYATLAPQASQAAVSATNEWYWSSNTLYVYSAGGNPATAYTSPGIQAAHRSYAITRNGQSYFNITGFTVEGGNGTGSEAQGNGIFVGEDGPGDGNTESSGVSISNITARYNSYEGVWLDSVNGTISNASIHDNLYIGMDFDTGANMTGTNISADNNDWGTYPGSYLIAEMPNLTLVNFEAHGNANNGIVLSKGSNYVIKGCTLYDNTYNGIYFDGSAVTGTTISGCTIYSNGAAGIYNAGGASVTGITAESNLIYGNTGQGVYTAGTVTLYNNVLEGNSVCYEAAGSSTSLTAKNNICYNNTTEGQIDSSLAGTLALNYNDYYHSAGGSFMNWHGTGVSFSTWQSDSSQDGNSITSNPNFVSVPSNFALQSGSPAIAAGTPLSPNINTFLGVPFASPPSMGAYGP